jgi:hypothetical protein
MSHNRGTLPVTGKYDAICKKAKNDRQMVGEVKYCTTVSKIFICLTAGP